MKIILTKTFTVTTDVILIRREDSTHVAGTAGVIPKAVAVSKIIIEPVSASDTLMVRGINEASDWVTLRAGAGFESDGFRPDDILFGYIKSAGSVAVNMYVAGV